VSIPIEPACRNPTLSIITPAYNVELYLSGCIKSVLNQTYRDFEHLIVDDGSRDGTARVLAQYAASDGRVRGFRGPNRGVSHARNVAMQHARGRYFAFLDADDEWQPEFARELTRVLESHPEMAVVSGNAFNWGGGALDGLPVRPWPAEPQEIRLIDMIDREDAVFVMSVVRRDVYEAIGGFNEALHRSEDYEWWMRAAAAGFRFLSWPKPLAHYRRRHDSATADESAMFESIMQVLRNARAFRHRARPDELGAIDRQLERLHAAHVLSLGKAALIRRDFVEAESRFWELYCLGRGCSFALMSLAVRLAPQLVLRAYRTRLSRLQAQTGVPDPTSIPLPAAAEERQ
jgi:glycosyltransferase involved in cell wall biosynthesis